MKNLKQLIKQEPVLYWTLHIHRIFALVLFLYFLYKVVFGIKEHFSFNVIGNFILTLILYVAGILNFFLLLFSYLLDVGFWKKKTSLKTNSTSKNNSDLVSIIIGIYTIFAIIMFVVIGVYTFYLFFTNYHTLLQIFFIITGTIHIFYFYVAIIKEIFI